MTLGFGFRVPFKGISKGSIKGSIRGFRGSGTLGV